MSNYRLKLDDDNTTIWEIYKDDTLTITLFYDKINNNMTVWTMEFILNEDSTWEAFHAEKEELRHSCGYGHWQKIDSVLDKELIDFMYDVMHRSK